MRFVYFNYNLSKAIKNILIHYKNLEYMEK